jgi:hypothetical protein
MKKRGRIERVKPVDSEKDVENELEANHRICCEQCAQKLGQNQNSLVHYSIFSYASTSLLYFFFSSSKPIFYRNVQW